MRVSFSQILFLIVFLITPFCSVHAQELARQEALRKIAELNGRISTLIRSPQILTTKIVELELEILAIQESTFGVNSPEAIETLENLAKRTVSHDNVAAQEYIEEALRRTEQAYGKNGKEAFIGKLKVTDLWLGMDEGEQVIDEYAQLIQERRDRYGREHTNVATLLDTLAFSYMYRFLYNSKRYDYSQYPRAASLLKEALRIRQLNADTPASSMQTNYELLAIAYSNYGQSYQDQESIQQGQLFAEKANQLKEQVEREEQAMSAANRREPDKPERAASSPRRTAPASRQPTPPSRQPTPASRKAASAPNQTAAEFTGELYEPMFSWETMLINMDTQAGGVTPDMLMWARNYRPDRDNRDFDLDLFADIIGRAALGTDGQTATILFKLARAYREQGDFVEAEAIYEMAWTYLRHRRRNRKNPLFAELCIEQTQLYLQVGRVEDIPACIEELMPFLEKEWAWDDWSHFRKKMRSIEDAYIVLAQVALAQGLLEDAEFYAQRAVYTGFMLNYIDLTNYAIDAYFSEEVRPYTREEGYERVDFDRLYDDIASKMAPLNTFIADLPGEMDRRMAQAGPYSIYPKTALSLYALASVYLATERPRQASLLLNVSIEVLEKIFGKMEGQGVWVPEWWISQERVRPGLSGLFNHNLALAHLEQGRLAEAERFLIEAMRIHRMLVGPQHVDYFRSRDALVFVKLLMGDQRAAAEYLFNEGRESDFDSFYSVLAYSGEKQQQSMLQQERVRLDLHLSLAATMRDDPAVVNKAYEFYLKRKALRLNVAGHRFAIQKEATDEESKKLINQSRLLALRISGLAYSGEDTRGQLSFLTRELEINENQLARRSGVFLNNRLRDHASSRQISQALGRNERLVEYVKYYAISSNSRRQISHRYGAFVVHPDGAISFTDLADADAVDPLVRVYHQELRDIEPGSGAAQLRNSEERLHLLTKEMHKHLIEPLALPSSGSLYLALDGLLHLLSFDTLSDQQGMYLIDNYAISYVATGKDLIEPPSEVPTRGVIVFADPDYDSNLGARSVVRSSGPRGGQSDFERPHFQRLNGTRAEAKVIQELLGLPSHHVFQGRAARESELLAVQSPTTLHLATHGFFEGDFTRGNKRMSSLSLLGVPGAFSVEGENPSSALLQTGLAFAGANSFKGASAGEEEDGILTASEVLTMDLEGTSLVVLSACETGLGAIENSEGVFGLSRSFQLAGAQTVVMSLWSVSDYSTSFMMEQFYQNLLQNMTKREGLRNAAISLRANPQYAHPVFWGAFVLSGHE